MESLCLLRRETAAERGTRLIEPAAIEDLIAALARRGYEVIGPTVRDGAIVLDRIASAAELPAGWADEQEAGTYRLRKRGDAALFGYRVGPHSWKRFLFPPEVTLWKSRRTRAGLRFEAEPSAPRPLAFLGVRPCDLGAIAVQDRVLLRGATPDPVYSSRRERAFLVAVNCVEPGATCFCASMGTGPEATSGFDIALTEIVEPGRHVFLAAAGSAAGADLLDELPGRDALPEERELARARLGEAASRMGRRLETQGLALLLRGHLDHPRWEEVGKRCLACANCTLVCPTCFCTAVVDANELSGRSAERRRRWDSCFTLGFSYLHGGSVRTSTGARYRQWLTHKLSWWVDQFGTSGCVGCGRCIAWCPAGIDITEEARALREPPPAAGSEKRAMIEGIAKLVEKHPFFEGMDEPALALVSGCGKNVRIPAGMRIARLGSASDHFYALRGGRVSVEIHAPGQGHLVIETLAAGEILGWSWLFPPYTWAFDASAIDDTIAVEFDGACLRKKCEANPALGYDLMKRFAGLFADRLGAARLQLMDLYGRSRGD